MPIGSDVQLSVIVQLFGAKEMQKEHLSSAPMSPDSTLTKDPDASFHMTAILVFQANPVRVELFTSCERFEPRSHFKRLSLTVRVNVVLNRTVVVDSD